MAKQILSDHAKQHSLKKFAKTCEERKQNGCVGPCEVCQFNIARYVDDIRDAAVIQTDAMMQVAKEQAERDAAKISGFIKLVVLGVVVIFLMRWCATI